METIFLAVFLMGMLWLISRAIAVYLRVRSEGVRHSEELLRAGVTLDALRKGEVPDRGAGALLPAREGLTAVSSSSGLEVKGTRTIARDIF